ncbi:MAG: tetratricopeptide repeat protein [Gammaproteobacteria bacterium]
MTEYLTEQEQIELLKNWVKQYALVILAGVVIAVIAITGWRYWQQRQTRILNHASAVYDDMLTMRAQNNAAGTLIQAQKLFTHYHQTVYGQLAALAIARDAVNKKDFDEAKKQLNWVIGHSKVASIRQIACLRLARLQLAEQKPEESLKTLDDVDDKNFLGLINEVKGDAYLAMKKPDEARKAYADALKTLPNADVLRPLLQMKYDNLATFKKDNAKSAESE